MSAAKQTPSTEAASRAECATPTDLKIDKNLLKVLENFKIRIQWILPKEYTLQEYSSEEALEHCTKQ